MRTLITKGVVAAGVLVAMSTTLSLADQMHFCAQGAEMEVRFARDAYGMLDPDNAKAYKKRCFSRNTTYQVNIDGQTFGVYHNKEDAVSEVRAYLTLKRLRRSPETVAYNLKSIDDRSVRK